MRRKLAAMAATLCAGGCFGDFGLGDSSGPHEPELLRIMIGAEVALYLNDCDAPHGARLVHCAPSASASWRPSRWGRRSRSYDSP